MKKYAIRFANKAHTWPSPWTRRAALIAAVAAMVTLDILFWLLMPLWMVIFFVWSIVKAGWDAGFEIPTLTVNSAVSDIADWRHNLPGIARIWRSSKETS